MRYIKYFATLLMALAITTNVNAQKKHFEGEVFFSTSVTLDKTSRKFLKGAEGEYKMKTVFKNGKEKSQENYFGTVSYLFRDEDMGYAYNPLTKKGYKYKYSASVEDYQNIRKVENSSVKPTGETKEAFGLKFERYKGEDVTNLELLGAKLTGVDEIEYWVCTDYDENWVMSIKIPGLYESFDLRSSMKMPLLGGMEQRLEVSIENLEMREVSDDEFELPKDVEFEEVSTMAQAESKLKKDYTKYKKAQGKQKGEDVKQEGAARYEGDWEF